MRFALRGGLPSRVEEVPRWALAVPFRLWNQKCRPDGKTFGDLHRGRSTSALPLRAIYLVFLFVWPLVAMLRAVGRGRGAARYYRHALFRPEFALLYPKGDFPDAEVAWGRPDYALAMLHGALYAGEPDGYFALDDKRTFVARCRREGLPIPPTFTVAEALARGGEFVVKAPGRDLGFGVAVVDADELETLPAPDEWVIQERLRNHPTLREVFSDEAPLSSLRVLTVRDPGTGGLRVLRCAVRIGRAGSVVDNTQQGGIWSAVDRSTGTLRAGVTKKTFGKWHHGEPLRHGEHPDTGRSFVGVRVPWLAEGEALALRAHEVLCPDAIALGWDLALAEGGISLLEVNVWATCYDHDPNDDAFTPCASAIVERLTRGARPSHPETPAVEVPHGDRNPE